jgi:cell division septal protein FtsQ
MNADRQNVAGQVVAQKPVRKRWGLWLLIPQLAAFLVLFVFAAEWKDSLKVQHVVVSGTRLLPAVDVYGWAKVPMKSALFGINLSEIYGKIVAQPFVKSVAVYRQLPDAVHIHINEREPIATLNIGQLFFIDDEGVLLPYCHTAVKLDVPVINGIGGVDHVQVGEVAASNEVFQAIEILKTAREVDTAIYRLISEVNMNGGGDITLYSVDGGVPITLGRGDIGKKLVTLRAFLGNILKNEDPKKLRSIDLRFDEEVVVRWDQKSERYPKSGSL